MKDIEIDLKDFKTTLTVDKSSFFWFLKKEDLSKVCVCVYLKCFKNQF